MLMLMQQGWPWLIIGLIVSAWGVRLLGMSFIDWIQFLIRLPFVYFSDDTQTEKELAKETIEQVTEQNPGCLVLALGLIAILVGLFKVLL